MKQIQTVLFILTVSLFTQSVQAQFSVGLFGDLNSSNLSGNAPSGTAYTGSTVLGGGVIIDYKVTDEVIISLQPMSLPKGTTVSYDLPSYEEQRDSVLAKFSYFTIPLMVKVKASKVVYVAGGFDIGFLTSANSKHVNSGDIYNIKDQIASLDVSANFGVGFTFNVASFNLFAEGRYSQGLLNVSNINENTESNIPPEFKNTGIQVLFGVLYNFGQ